MAACTAASPQQQCIQLASPALSKPRTEDPGSVRVQAAPPNAPSFSAASKLNAKPLHTTDAARTRETALVPSAR